MEIIDAIVREILAPLFLGIAGGFIGSAIWQATGIVSKVEDSNKTILQELKDLSKKLRAKSGG